MRACNFYEASCQVAPIGRKSDVVFEHTSGERARPLQPARGCARDRVNHPHASSSSVVWPRRRSSEVTHTFIRAHPGTSGAGARDEPKEEQGPLSDGSHVRPELHARLLLQLDDLTTYTGAATDRAPWPLVLPVGLVEFTTVDSRSGRATWQTASAPDAGRGRPPRPSCRGAARCPGPTRGTGPCADPTRATRPTRLARVRTADRAGHYARDGPVVVSRPSCSHKGTRPRYLAT